MPYWIHAKIKESAFSVIVETAKDALALAELTEAGFEVVARGNDWIDHPAGRGR
jgi:hypothetical protein